MLHSVDNLCYQLLEGPVCLEPLRVLDKRRISWHNGHVTFYVLGASHAVRIETERGCLTELLTCAPLTTPGRRFAESDITEKREWHVAAPDLLCSVQVQPFALTEGDALSGRFGEANMLAVAYPSHADGQTPITRIGWNLDGQSLYVETVHTYPEEGRGARSTSSFVLTDAGMTATRMTEAKSYQDALLLESIV